MNLWVRKELRIENSLKKEKVKNVRLHLDERIPIRQIEQALNGWIKEAQYLDFGLAEAERESSESAESVRLLLQ